jgi:hypothetical protein
MWPAIGAAGRVSADSSSERAMTLAGTWLTHCLSAHTACKESKTSSSHAIAPTRVLDVGLESGDIRLYEPARDEQCRYAALTYCWGTGGTESTGPTTTTKANYAQRKARISFYSLSRTLQDAVRITRSLSISFLWIDALCIIQDSPEDWDRESSTMSSIFANSTVTIAADGATHCHEGCFVAGEHRNRTILRIPCPGLQEKDVKGKVVKQGKDSFVYIRKPGVRNESNGSHAAQTLERPAIDTRAWTMQERLLAPRMLHYTASELVWECAVETRCECQVAVKDSTILNYSPFKQKYMADWSQEDGERTAVNRSQSRRHHLSKRFSSQLGPSFQTILNVGRPTFLGQDLTSTPLFHGDSTNPRPRLRWRSVVVEYTQRNLTFDKDRLTAISGLASTMSEHDPMYYDASDYLFGIWKAELVRNLLWHVVGRDVSIFNDTNFKISQRLDYSYSPSWSWASITGAITYYDEITDEKQRATQLEPRTKLLSVTCTPTTQNPYGPGNGELEVEGDLIKVVLQTFTQGNFLVPRVFSPMSGPDALGDAYLDIQGCSNNETADEEEFAWLIVAHLVALGRSNISAQGIQPVGLLLKPVPGRVDTYRRVGLVKGHLRAAAWSKLYSSHQKKDNRRSLGGMVASMGQVRYVAMVTPASLIERSDFVELLKPIPTNSNPSAGSQSWAGGRDPFLILCLL